MKTYGIAPDADKRYSPPVCTGAKRKPKIGNPDWDKISTSYIECQNLTMRMHMRRFTRLTNAFSKKVEMHAHAVALHFMYYNFGKIHKTHRVTPAMAAGVTDRLWEVADMWECLSIGKTPGNPFPRLACMQERQMDDEEKARFDALIRLAEFRRQYRDARRSVEWRVNFAVWALMIGIATTLKSYSIGYAVVAVIAVAVLHCLWIRDNFQRNERDSPKMWAHYEAALAVVQAVEAPAPQPLRHYLQHFPAYAVVLITVSLGILTVVFTQLPSPSAKDARAVSPATKAQKAN